MTKSTPHLHVVGGGSNDVEIYNLGSGPETTAERVRRLQANARALAREQVELLAKALEDLAVLAREIAEGGDAYPVGIREQCERMAEDLPHKARGFRAITDRG